MPNHANSAEVIGLRPRIGRGPLGMAPCDMFIRDSARIAQSLSIALMLKPLQGQRISLTVEIFPERFLERCFVERRALEQRH